MGFRNEEPASIGCEFSGGEFTEETTRIVSDAEEALRSAESNGLEAAEEKARVLCVNPSGSDCMDELNKRVFRDSSENGEKIVLFEVGFAKCGKCCVGNGCRGWRDENLKRRRGSGRGFLTSLMLIVVEELTKQFFWFWFWLVGIGIHSAERRGERQKWRFNW